jgi:hypothetical protein
LAVVSIANRTSLVPGSPGSTIAPVVVPPEVEVPADVVPVPVEPPVVLPPVEVPVDVPDVVVEPVEVPDVEPELEPELEPVPVDVAPVLPDPVVVDPAVVPPVVEVVSLPSELQPAKPSALMAKALKAILAIRRPLRGVVSVMVKVSLPVVGGD